MSTILEEHEVYAEAQRGHRNPEDFYEGDLAERIEQFSHFELTMLAISELDLDEWEVDDDLVDEYLAQPAGTMPPIIFDAVSGSIIDGIHRANAVARRGDTEIRAYVGREEFLVGNNYSQRRPRP